MARRTTSAQTQSTLAVVTSTQQEKKRTSRRSAGEGMISIACALPFALKFDDVDDGKGGLKTVIFPGVNDDLRGKKHGILLGSGNSVLVNIPKSDWDSIVAKHGKEKVFNTYPPKLWPFNSEADYRAASDEVAEMRTGVEPVSPQSQGVEAADKNA